ncbi:LOW QUALITY PROTEIN: hypothetical protein RJ639_028338 [Escallonia herrerae]|uniref:Reverse transcriptase RNase H-like domain-containing protein n=1 Tax=Escallonia herrerae TaxID=1293975 RepID=A0AA89BP36_9ASTE|nr:LOW QUALITY PROTEIN: hypothetical protein RJ639_028338 [Escallonia herrerae]
MAKIYERAGRKRDSQLYCHFHEDHMHTTDECKVLQCEIENLITRGHLKQFIKANDRQQNRRRNQRRTEEILLKDLPLINTISGGPSAGGLSSSSRKTYARQEARPISSSRTRAFAPVRGIVSLTIVAEKCHAVHTLDFLIVSVKLSYNKILDRTGLNKLQAVASTYHLIMKFPTPTGVGFIKGDQTLARRCYVASCRAEETLSIDDQRDEKTSRHAEPRYPNAEKLAFTLLIATRKLRPYFQSHIIIVLTDKPLRKILHKPDLSGGLIHWLIELGEFDIHYHPRPSIKRQALADFIVECALLIEDEEPLLSAQSELFTWKLFVDGSSNNVGSGAGKSMKASADNTWEGEHYRTRFFDKDIIGRQCIAMLWTILKNVVLANASPQSPSSRQAPYHCRVVLYLFAMWGMDIMGPFPPATAQRRFVIGAIDYFTK